jgi:hypothetical protein
MDHAMAWSAYSGLYRGYEMASATSAFADSVWPHPSAHPFVAHHDGVDPLDPLSTHAASSPSTLPTSSSSDNFGAALQQQQVPI